MVFMTANWHPLGDAFYRKTDLYEMGWNIGGLRDCLIAAAPYGGPIALLKGSQRSERSHSARPVLEMYTSSGVPLANFPWKSGIVVDIGWTVSDYLLCIQENGTVLIYDILGNYCRHFNMGSESQNSVTEAKVFHSAYRTGVAILTKAYRFSVVTNIDDQKIWRLPDVPGLQTSGLSCWTVISQDRQTKLVLASGRNIYVLDNDSCTSVTVPGLDPDVSSYFHMSASFNYKYLALYTNTGCIWMGTSNLKEKLGEFDCKFHAPPKQMVWCRRPRSQQPSVVLMWDRLLLVAGKNNESIQYPLDDELYLVPELDGVRIIGSKSHEFLHEVPATCEEIFKIASMAPGALLLEAHKEYKKESQKADEYLREIKDQNLLPTAVEQCIEAAGFECEPETQKMLLRAASFGKSFLSNFSPEKFVTMCRELRVLNAVRDYTVGMPLTYVQFSQLTVQVLIDRLVFRRLYPLAIEICKHLKIREFQGVSHVLKHWACFKVQQKDPDEDIAHAINQKLGDTAGISYSEIAAKAYECGRPELAIMLLDFEPQSGEQVPLLLKMKRGQLALNKAIESGDTDLVYTVVMYLKNEMNRRDFFLTLRKHPVALSLYRQFCKHQEQDTLKDLYNQEDDHQELANFYVQESYQEAKVEVRVAELQKAVDEYSKARNEFAAKATEEQIKLLKFQRKLQDETDKPYVDHSLHDTVYNLLLEGSHRHAEQLYKDFKIPDKRYWWLKISALAEKNDWEELEKFSKSKKSPIGYLAFVEVCVKHHNKYEAKKYVSKVTPELKVKAHLLVGEVEQAADIAIERKNENDLNLVLSRCNQSTDRSLVERLNKARSGANKK
ncbi:vacuolar protein sorting-associated protein 16 homolog [Erpetoichthys calabaricus]|uniref:vacuolar protein sorting-associated protein 16 homolog n=1 Tax=Erpetoichthys calabaricus TaxID=27687 RepID=UPI00223424DD|nr:vacuolar protein sorting-associated protein 16 homolog [Erpetoichthys calabaricus]